MGVFWQKTPRLRDEEPMWGHEEDAVRGYRSIASAFPPLVADIHWSL